MPARLIAVTNSGREFEGNAGALVVGERVDQVAPGIQGLPADDDQFEIGRAHV